MPFLGGLAPLHGHADQRAHFLLCQHALQLLLRETGCLEIIQHRIGQNLCKKRTTQLVREVHVPEGRKGIGGLGTDDAFDGVALRVRRQPIPERVEHAHGDRCICQQHRPHPSREPDDLGVREPQRCRGIGDRRKARLVDGLLAERLALRLVQAFHARHYGGRIGAGGRSEDAPYQCVELVVLEEMRPERYLGQERARAREIQDEAEDLVPRLERDLGPRQDMHQ